MCWSLLIKNHICSHNWNLISCRATFISNIFLTIITSRIRYTSHTNSRIFTFLTIDILTDQIENCLNYSYNKEDNRFISSLKSLTYYGNYNENRVFETIKEMSSKTALGSVLKLNNECKKEAKKYIKK